jgi:hypothetical protein
MKRIAGCWRRKKKRREVVAVVVAKRKKESVAKRSIDYRFGGRDWGRGATDECDFASSGRK